MNGQPQPVQRFDHSSAACRIFTYKEGLLSPFAHDLRIKVTSFTVEVGGKDHLIRAFFDAGSLRVECAMENGKERPDLLNPKDREEINARIVEEVLDAKTYPDILLTSSSVKKEDSKYLVRGALSMHGRNRDISFFVQKMDNALYTADVELHLPDFGIKPFSALFGAVRIKPDILIHIEIPKNSIEEEILL